MYGLIKVYIRDSSLLGYHHDHHAILTNHIFYADPYNVIDIWLILIDLMHWRHRTAMLGVEAIALYTLVICSWHIADNCVYT